LSSDTVKDVGSGSPEPLSLEDERRKKINARRAKWREKNREEYNRKAREWRLNNIDKNRRTVLKQLYDITPEEVEQMEQAQAGLCAICHKKCPTNRRLSIDHDHETGRVRGLLCLKCNVAIGALNTPELLEQAKAYLLQPPVG
jgi:ferredoxin